MQETLKIDIKQIMQFIAEEKITPSALSPFYAEEPAAHAGGKLDAETIPLVRVVCNPSALVSARILSPEGAVMTRVYADKSGKMLVRHWLDKEGLHHFRHVEEKDIADEATLRLMLDIPPTRLDVDAELAETSFCALLGLIDGWREKTLLSLIDRKPGGKFSFTADDLYAAFRRSVSSADVRWLTPLVRELYPGNLDVSPSAFKEGLQTIVPKFVQAVAHGFELSPLGEELCATLGAPLAALKLTVSRMKNGAIIEEEMIGVRGMGVCCTIELEEDRRQVALKNSSAPMIELYIHSRLEKAFKAEREAGAQDSVKEIAKAAPAFAESVAIKDQEPPKKFCAECGKPLKPGAKFCAGCGTKI